MAVDYFLKFDSIEGESSDAQHKNEIEIGSFSWGEARAAAGGAGRGAGKVSMQDFQFTMEVNKASPKLFLACAKGEHLKQAVLSARSAGQEQQQPFLKYTFSDILVSSYKTGGSSQADSLPLEEVSFNFAKIEVEYRPQLNDGSLGSPVNAGWDLKKNAGV